MWLIGFRSSWETEQKSIFFILWASSKSLTDLASFSLDNSKIISFFTIEADLFKLLEFLFFRNVSQTLLKFDIFNDDLKFPALLFKLTLLFDLSLFLYCFFLESIWSHHLFLYLFCLFLVSMLSYLNLNITKDTNIIYQKVTILIHTNAK